MKKILLLLAVIIFLGVEMPTMAQTVSFTDQTRFIATKGSGSVNVRKTPNTKAPKMGSLYENQALPVLDEQDGWYQVLMTDGKKGWVSQTVCRIMDTPLNVEKACDHVYGVSEGYEDYAMWYVGKIQGTEMFVAYTLVCNMIEPIGWPDGLWLGKKVGNVLVFDQYVEFYASYSEDGPNVLNVSPDEYGNGGFRVSYGDKYAMSDNQEGKALRLSSIPLNKIKQIFNGKQKKGNYLFLGPQLFGKKYANVIFG